MDNKSKEMEIKQSVRQYPLPDFTTGFTFKMNPLYESPEKEDWHQWVYELSSMNEKMYKKVKQIDLCYAYFHPNCEDMSRYECLVKHGVLFFVFDDHTETKDGDIHRNQEQSLKIWGQFGQMIDKIEGRYYVSTYQWKPYVFAMYSVLKHVYRTYNDVQKRRFIKCWRYYMDGNLEETEFVSKRKSFANLEDLIQMRLKTVGGMAAFQMIEFADNLVVPEHVWEDDRTQKLLELASINLITVNDIFSFEKELRDAKCLDEVFNQVAVISRIDKLSISESMQKLKTMIEDNEQQIREVEEELTSEPDCLQVTKDFIEALNNFMGGHFKAGTLLERYNKFD